MKLLFKKLQALKRYPLERYAGILWSATPVPIGALRPVPFPAIWVVPFERYYQVIKRERPGWPGCPKALCGRVSIRRRSAFRSKFGQFRGRWLSCCGRRRARLCRSGTGGVRGPESIGICNVRPLKYTCYEKE